MTMKSNALLGVGLAAVLNVTPVWAAESKMGTTLDDAVLTTKVKTALIEDPALKARQISVETHQGVVQLNGFVDSANDIKAAEATAKTVAGVTSVDNNLQLSAGDRSAGKVVDDTTITAKIKSALLSDPRTKAYQVEVKTNNGVVSLGGFVSSDKEKQVAGEVAQSVAGVLKVENGIMVSRG